MNHNTLILIFQEHIVVNISANDPNRNQDTTIPNNNQSNNNPTVMNPNNPSSNLPPTQNSSSTPPAAGNSMWTANPNQENGTAMAMIGIIIAILGVFFVPFIELSSFILGGMAINRGKKLGWIAIIISFIALYLDIFGILSGGA
jgi:hypothetical protein